MNFELWIVSDQFKNHLIDTVVHFDEFLEFIWFGSEDFYAELGFTIFYSLLSVSIFTHEEQQLKEKLTYAQMKTNYLPFGDWSLKLSIGVLSGCVFQKIFYLFGFFSDLHHSQIRYFSLWFCSSPLQILPQID